MTFEEAWKICRDTPGSFTKVNAQALWNAAKSLPPQAWMVEVGVDQGRSTSILMGASQAGQTLLLVDSWESVLIDNKAKVEALLARFPRERYAEARVIHAPSAVVGKEITKPLHLVHIDANHYDEYPAQDCEAWLPRLVPGGLACFHDYDSTFTAVKIAVDKYTKGWEVIGNFESLAVRRKP